MKQGFRGMSLHPAGIFVNFALCLMLALTLQSCSRKKESPKYEPNKEMQAYVFDNLIKGNAPEFFERLMNHKVFMEGGRSVYLFEKLYPECTGIVDSQGFYSGECDDGSWVDDILFKMEEQRMGEEVLGLLEDETFFEPPMVQDEQELVEKRLLDVNNRLKAMEYGKEYFIPVQNNNSSIIVHYCDNKAIRYFYDPKYRLVKKENWFMQSVEDSHIVSKELFEYEEDSIYPKKKIIENQTSRLISTLNQNGLVVRAEKFLLVENAEDKTDKKERTQSITTYEYDDKDRLVTEQSIDYLYEGETLKRRLSKKQVFIYKQNDENSDIPPDYEYYEDNVLRTSTEYTEKGKYSTLIIFDEENSVRTYYENHVKVKDVYMSGGKEKRVRMYE